jgi:hypothetical protein
VRARVLIRRFRRVLGHSPEFHNDRKICLQLPSVHEQPYRKDEGNATGLAWEEKSSQGSEIVRRINQNHIHLWDMGTGSFLRFYGRHRSIGSRKSEQHILFLNLFECQLLLLRFQPTVSGSFFMSVAVEGA